MRGPDDRDFPIRLGIHADGHRAAEAAKVEPGKLLGDKGLREIRRERLFQGLKMALRVDYDQIAPTYEARYTFGLYDGVLEALRALVLLKKPDSVLEVGCGTGYWLAALRTVSPRIYGVDYSLEMLRKAGDRDPTIRLVRATAEVIPFHSGTFDLIFCINAIHHFERIEQFIAEARRLLRPSGILWQ